MTEQMQNLVENAARKLDSDAAQESNKSATSSQQRNLLAILFALLLFVLLCFTFSNMLTVYPYPDKEKSTLIGRGDLEQIDQFIAAYRTMNGNQLPESLAEAGVPEQMQNPGDGVSISYQKTPAGSYTLGWESQKWRMQLDGKNGVIKIEGQ